MPNKTILVVEDEQDIQQLVTYHLIRENYSVVCADTGEDALEKFEQEDVDLVVLDLMLPGISGIQVCRTIKKSEKGKNIPVIMLTALSEEEDVVDGLEKGADDYITKPFSPKVLVARVKAHLRRNELMGEAMVFKEKVSLPFGLVIDNGLHQVYINDEPLDLTVSEFKVLRFFAARPGRVFSRQQIIEAIRGQGYEVTSRAVDVLIHGLRRKLGPAGTLIETVRGIGYRFKVD